MFWKWIRVSWMTFPAGKYYQLLIRPVWQKYSKICLEYSSEIKADKDHWHHENKYYHIWTYLPITHHHTFWTIYNRPKLPTTAPTDSLPFLKTLLPFATIQPAAPAKQNLFHSATTHRQPPPPLLKIYDICPLSSSLCCRQNGAVTMSASPSPHLLA